LIYDPKNRISKDANQVMHADGFEDAVLGVAEGFGGKRTIIYSHQKCVEILTEKHGMDMDAALDFIDGQLIGAWVGEGTPMLLFEMSFAELQEYIGE